MSPTHKSTLRMVAASFAAGAGAMVLVGLVGPVAFNGGLGLRDALASQVEERPVVEPLDVQAVRARLAEADRTMASMREHTDDDISRLQNLAGR